MIEIDFLFKNHSIQIISYAKPAAFVCTNAVTFLLLFALLEMTISAIFSFCAQYKRVRK